MCIELIIRRKIIITYLNIVLGDKKMYCSNCGEEIDERMNFCPYCGEEIKMVDNEDGKQEQSKLEKKEDINVPDKAIELFKEGYDLCNSKEYEEGIKKFDEAIDLCPNYIKPHRNKGIALKFLGEKEKALESFNEALKIDSYDCKTLLWKGKTLMYLEGHTMDEPLECFNKVLEKDPKNTEALEKKAEILRTVAMSDDYRRLGISQNFLKEIDELLEIESNNAKILNAKALVLNNLNRVEEALDTIDRAIDIEPNYYESWITKANCENLLGNIKEAIRCAERAIEINPDGKFIANAWFMKGLCLKTKCTNEMAKSINNSFNKSEMKEAIECFNKSLNKNPESAFSLIAKADALSGLNKDKRALDCVLKAIKKQPENSQAWGTKSMLLKKLGKDDQAKRAAERALEIDPTNQSALNVKSQLEMKEMRQNMGLF